jgi:uncharacterized protein YbaP (TraB family)
MMRAARYLFPLLAMLLVTACGDAPKAPEGGGPAIWRVQRGDMDGWLFGTVHILPDGVAWQTPRLQDATAKADRLVLEIANLEDRAAVVDTFERLGRSPALPPIADRIAPGERSALDELTKAGVTAPDALRPYESWAAAMLLSAAIQRTLGVSDSNGVESVLTRRFREAGKPIEGLETVEQQFSAFDTLPEPVQRRMLGETVTDAGAMKGSFDRIVAAWMKGDLAALAHLGSGTDKPDPLVEGAVLGARNRAWVARIETMRGHPFIAVGTAHLAGDDNLVALLQARGFAVTRIQ